MLLVIASLLAFACAEERSPPLLRTTREGPNSPHTNGPKPAFEPARAPELIIDPDSILNPKPDPASPEAPAAEPEPEPEPSDPLAPILPSGPEPGSPEADAELAELLEESTLTQEEFDAAFRDNKPNIAGDQLVFGPSDRTRKRPVISIGTPKIEHGKLAASEISALVKAHLRGFEGCLAVALTEDPAIAGSLTLRVRFDAKGEADSATIEDDAALGGGAALGEPLRECLVAVADNWSLASAAGATVAVLLSLASE